MNKKQLKKEKLQYKKKEKLRQDERYYSPLFLNKWFAISSLLFAGSMLWMVYDDWNDPYKVYQEEFKEIESGLAEAEWHIADSLLNRAEINRLDTLLLSAKETYILNRDIIALLESEYDVLEGDLYKINMDYLAQKAILDEGKAILERDSSHANNEHPVDNKIINKYTQDEKETIRLKNLNDDIENELKVLKDSISSYDEYIIMLEDSIGLYKKDIELIEDKWETVAPERMTFSNQIANLIRDLPGLDFLNPYYKINQIVVDDVKYDVNFAKVPTVDRCTTCHLGITNPAYSKENLIYLGLYNENNNTIIVGEEEINAQPYLAHPNLDLYLSSSSPHSIEEFGCTSCHSGRGRGTTFISTVHMPNNEEQEKEWKEKYGWEQMHYWLEPMLPTKYIEASCFKCHNSQPILEGGEKLALGLLLIDKSGCNNCHLIETFASDKKSAPPLTDIGKKLDKEWVSKWINDPQSFRHNTWMPHFFNQDNNSSEDMVKRNETEIYAITEYLFQDTESTTSYDLDYLGNPTNGESLFNVVGCRGCHIISEESIDIEISDLPYEMLKSEHGYEKSGDSIEIMDRYNLLKYQGPNLIGLSSKTDAKWVYKWIMDPTNYWKHTKMPNLRLSKEEAKDITAYLMTFKTNSDFESKKISDLDVEELDDIVIGWKLKSYSQSDADKALDTMSLEDKINYAGMKSINYYGCYSCHDIKGFETSRPIGAELTYVGTKDLHKLDFGHIHKLGHTNFLWFEQKLTNPRIFDRFKIVANEDKLRMPNFYFKPEEVEAIVTALLGFSSKQISDNKVTYNLVENKKIFDGYKLIYKNNCQGCHVIEDFGGQISELLPSKQLSPPNLSTQGKKVQPEWLFDFFKHPQVIRPNLDVRMPTFNFTDDEWNSIILALQHMDENNLSFESEYIPDVSSELGNLKINIGEWVFNSQAPCYSCHIGADNDNIPNNELKSWAPNLGDVKNRLRPDWVVDWMNDPQAIMDYTNMLSVADLVPSYSEIDTLDLSQYDSLECEIFYGKWESGLCKDVGLIKLKDYIKNENSLDEDDFKVLILEGLRDYLYLLDNSHKDLIPLFIENKKQEEQDSNEENNLDEEW